MTLQRKIVRTVRLANGDSGQIIGISLRQLRELAGVTQEEMARRLSVRQASISKIERRGDIHINSLRRYVEALGAELRIEATLPSSGRLATRYSLLFEPEIEDENQLVLPIFEDNVFRPHRDVVLSIRPHYCAEILKGRKTVELRRRFPLFAPRGTIAYIYSTSPEQAMVGLAQIENVWRLPVQEIWARFRKSASIRRADFQEYFRGLNEGFAIQLTKARRFPRALTLPELRDRFGFEPPQSFLYATPILREALRYEFPNLSN
jgi:predicted transcriptional regulator/DNA-binding XRE family transcriptional regulator